jgi:hypothetical protein
MQAARERRGGDRKGRLRCALCHALHRTLLKPASRMGWMCNVPCVCACACTCVYSFLDYYGR